MKPSQTTMVELRNESYQKQSRENSAKFRVIRELPSYLEKYFKTMRGLECVVEPRKGFNQIRE